MKTKMMFGNFLEQFFGNFSPTGDPKQNKTSTKNNKIMYKTKRFLTVLAALFILTAGAWADGVTASEIDATVSAGWGSDESLIKASDLPGYNKITLEQAMTWASAPASGTVYLIYEIVADGELKIAKFEDGNYTDSFGWSEETRYFIWEDINYGGKRYFYTTGPAPAAPVDVTLNEAQTEATLTMPAENVTMTYELVRDLTVSVTFRGVPTDGKPLTVMPAAGGKYEFADAETTFTLHDDIEGADITDSDINILAQLKGDDGEWTTLFTSLDAFLAEPQPGTWRLQAEAAADSPYDGIAQSADFQIASVAIYAVNATGDDTDGAEGATVTATTADGQPIEVGETLHDAAKGKTVNVTITPRPGYRVKSVKAVKGAGAAEPAPAITSPAVGQIIGSDGKNYAADATLPTGVTKVAMIAYVNGSNGLAIQLNSSPVSKTWEEAKTYAESLNTSTPIAGGTWRLPSKEDWQNMFLGCAVSGDASSASDMMDPIAGFKEKIAATGTSWQSSGYWSSTSSGSSAWSVGVSLNGSNASAYFVEDYTSFPYRVLGCLAF